MIEVMGFPRDGFVTSWSTNPSPIDLILLLTSLILIDSINIAQRHLHSHESDDPFLYISNTSKYATSK